MPSPRKTLAKLPESPRENPNSPSYFPIQIALITAPKIAGRQQSIARNACVCLLAGDSAGRLESGKGSFRVVFVTEKNKLRHKALLRHMNLIQGLLLLAIVNPHWTEGSIKGFTRGEQMFAV